MTEETFGDDQTDWRKRIFGEVRASGYCYFALKAPAGRRTKPSKGSF